MAGPVLSGQFQLTPKEAEPLLSTSRNFSWFQRFANPIILGLAGTNIPVFDTDFEGGWVEESAAKPVADDVVSNKFMARRKWAMIVAVTAEVARASSSGEQGIVGYVPTIRDRIAASLARDIDKLAATGSGIGGQSYVNQTTKSVALGTATKANGGIWADLNSGLQLLVEDEKSRSLDGFVFDNVVEPIMNGSVDNNGLPLFIDRPLIDSSPAYRPGGVMGRPAGLVKNLRNGVGAAQVVGYGGDFSRAYYGFLSPISFDVSDSASYVNKQGATISAYQNNLVLIRAEAELGVLIADPEDFVKFTSAVGAPAS